MTDREKLEILMSNDLDAVKRVVGGEPTPTNITITFLKLVNLELQRLWAIEDALKTRGLKCYL